MFILFDHSTPAPLRHALSGHQVVEAFERGWDRLVNGVLLDTAETEGFELLITADKNMRYQQTVFCPVHRSSSAQFGMPQSASVALSVSDPVGLKMQW
jgi:hypothetical protein